MISSKILIKDSRKIKTIIMYVLPENSRQHGGKIFFEPLSVRTPVDIVMHLERPKITIGFTLGDVDPFFIFSYFLRLSFLPFTFGLRLSISWNESGLT